MKNQERFDELLTLFVDGELAPTEQEEFNLLLEQNPEWKKQAHEEKQLVELMRQIPKAKAPANLMQSVLENVHDVQPVNSPEPTPGKKKSHKLIVIGFATAAAAALVLGAVSTMLMSGGDGGEEITVAKAEIKQEAPHQIAGRMAAPAKEQLRLDSPVAEVDEATVSSEISKSSLQDIDLDGDLDIVVASAPSYDIGNDGKAIAANSFNAPPEPRAPYSAGREIKTSLFEQASQDEEDEKLPSDFFAMDSPDRSNTASDYGNFDPRSEELAYSNSPTSSEPATFMSKLDSLEAVNESELDRQTRDQQGEQIASFEYFMGWMKDNKGKFLFYTPDQEVAFEVSKSADDFIARFKAKTDGQGKEVASGKKLALRSMTMQEEAKETPTPIPPNAKSGYVLFHFRSKKEAEYALQQMKQVTGDGVKNLDLNKAVLVDQPDGVRLVIPYQLLEIDGE
jgi:hypothetical protein